MGRVNRKNTFYDKRTHFEKRKNEHKPINNNQLHKPAPDRPKKNEPISPVAAKLHAKTESQFST
jgi:hypothetical protein